MVAAADGRPERPRPRLARTGGRFSLAPVTSIGMVNAALLTHPNHRTEADD